MLKALLDDLVEKKKDGPIKKSLLTDLVEKKKSGPIKRSLILDMASKVAASDAKKEEIETLEPIEAEPKQEVVKPKKPRIARPRPKPKPIPQAVETKQIAMPFAEAKAPKEVEVELEVVEKVVEVTKVEKTVNNVNVERNVKVDASGKEIVRAINALRNQMVQAAKEKPERKPVPFRFTLTRNRQGLIESAIAEPL